MYKIGRPKLLVDILVLSFMLISTLSCANCRRLSLRDSLTAYADKTSSESEVNIEQTSKTPEKDNSGRTTAWPWTSNQENKNESPTRSSLHQNLGSGGRVWNPTLKEPKVTNSNTGNQLSLWGLTKLFPFTFGQATNKKVPNGASVPSRPPSINTAYFNKPNNLENQTENKTKSLFNSAPVRETALNTSRSDGSAKIPNEQKRDKKEIASAYGLSGLLWNTATALWSVNREHFLPTFLHTKTGGKLSLVRDSIFKPVTILSQFRNGVQEINNEKLRNLARLSSGGWGRPDPQVFVVKLQPENSRLLTLARYIFRLTKHTAVTKFKLKRALLDLQIRAAKRLVRIITSKNIAQKIAAIRILTNAIWKGKIAVLRIFTGPRRTTTTPAPYGPYPGVDNAVNVDITYSSLNKHNSQQWTDYVPPARTIPPPPPPPSPPVTFTNYYAPPTNPVQPLPVPNTLFIPPAPAPQQSLYRTDYSAPPPEWPLPSLSYQAISPTPTPVPLIEQPSYANLLKEMGISPGNYYDARDYAQSNSPATTKTLVNSTTEIPTPRPTVVYYYSGQEKSHVYNGTSLSNVIEAPAVSFSYHSSYQQEPKPLKDITATITSFEKDREYRDNKITGLLYEASTPPPRNSFRFKILEAMGVGKQK